MIEPPDFHCLYTLYTNQSGILDMGISFFSVFFSEAKQKVTTQHPPLKNKFSKSAI